MMFGKMLGIFFGYLLLGPVGAVLGCLIGHAFDKGLNVNLQWEASNPDDSDAKTLFFKATFSIMGYLAKIDGYVNEQEIAMAREVMNRMQLSESQKQEAIAFFHEGKAQNFDMRVLLTDFHHAYHNQPQLKNLFLEIQAQAVLVDGQLHPREYEALLQIAHHIRVPRFMLDQVIARIQAMAFFAQARSAHSGQQQYHGYHRQHRYSSGVPPETARSSLEEAYKMMGVTASSSDQEIKKAYRRLMNEHHPDKLVAKGLPPEMMKVATEKTQQIQQAYDLICKNRSS